MAEHPPLSQRAYAKRRGVSHVAVNRAIRSGRLARSVNADGQIVDADLADQEWSASTDLTRANQATLAQHAAREPVVPAPEAASEGMSLADATRIEKVWKARAAELKFREAARELVPASEVRQEISNAYATVRTHLLGVPSRAKQSLPHLSAGDVVVLEELVREALEALVDGAS